MERLMRAALSTAAILTLGSAVADGARKPSAITTSAHGALVAPANGTGRGPISGFSSIHMYSRRDGLGITRSGLIEQSRDGGRQWANVTPTGAKATGVATYLTRRDAQIAWIVVGWRRAAPTILMTPNGGYSFQRRPLPAGIAVPNVAGLVFVNENRGWLITERKGRTSLFRTDNNGLTWSVAQ